MNLLHISNTFAQLVQQSAFFQSYHFGYHSDINTNTANIYDPGNEAGKMFPHVLWAAPVEGSLSMQGDTGRDFVEVMLYFYALQDYQNDGEPVRIENTLIRQWHDLKARAVEFLHGANKSRMFRIVDGKVKYFTDANAQIDRLLCVGCEFTVQLNYGCCDYENQTPPLSAAQVETFGVDDIEARHVG